MCDYIRVAEDEHLPEEAIELPSDEDGTILLSTIQAQFPGSTGLRFRNEETQTWRGVRLADGVLYPPVSGWRTTLYIVVSSKPGKCCLLANMLYFFNKLIDVNYRLS
jgi:hypothetical protein